MNKKSDMVYKDWLVRKVCNLPQIRKYSRLWDKLYSTEYTWVIPKDSNRAADGIRLRDKTTAEMIPFNEPCTVLEMLVALACRIEDDVMGDVMAEPRIDEWFWIMIDNLGLDQMDDKHYDDSYVEDKLYSFMHNEFNEDGLGGLFYVENCAGKMNKAEIWYQMIWYFNDYMYRNGM